MTAAQWPAGRPSCRGRQPTSCAARAAAALAAFARRLPTEVDESRPARGGGAGGGGSYSAPGSSRRIARSPTSITSASVSRSRAASSRNSRSQLAVTCVES
jgi:hypothetical protein